MQRIRRQQDAEAIRATFDLLPGRLCERLGDVHFLTRTDPLFVGLHRYETTDDGHSYRSTAHVTYPFHQMHLPADRRATTVVLPSDYALRVRTITHELGHALDWRLGFKTAVTPVTDYARTDRYEAFAEAFAAWALPYGHGLGDAEDQLLTADPVTVALFEQLAFD